MTQREMVLGSLAADDARESHYSITPRRHYSAPKHEAMRPAGVRKMRQSRKRRKGDTR